MRDLLIVFKFELFNQLRKKTVIVTTIILAIILFLLTSIPTIIKFFDHGKTSDNSEIVNREEKLLPHAAFYVVNSQDKEILVNELHVDQGAILDSEQALKDEILKEKGNYSIGFVVNSMTDFKTIYKDRSFSSYETDAFKNALRQYGISKNLKSHNLTPETYEQIQKVDIKSSEEVLGRNAANNVFFAYAMIIIIYLLINLYGSSISTSIAREKDSRTMELLITSVKPASLIVGKVAAMGVSAIIQITIIILGGVIGFMLSKHNYPELILMLMKSSLAMDTLLVYLVYFLIGYILYLFIFASMGSVVSKVEDVASAIGPINFIFMIGYFVSFMAMTAPDRLIAKIASWVPFTSLMVMPTRFPLTSIPVWEMMMSLAILILTTVFFAYLSIKIYRMGSLNYGNKIGFFKSIKMALTKQD